MTHTETPSCIYCAQPAVFKGIGEHIIPAALGGKLTLDCVCDTCNRSFSTMEKELYSRSPVSVIASNVLGNQLWQAWDVAHDEANLLLEARPIWSKSSISRYPQIVFGSRGPAIYGDFEDVAAFGSRFFYWAVTQCARRSLRRYERSRAMRDGKAKRERPWLLFERVMTDQLANRGYRFPPRIFAPYSISEIKKRLAASKRVTLTLRYATDADKWHAMNGIDLWHEVDENDAREIGWGSVLPASLLSYDKGMVARALMKMGFNVLSHCAPNTPVNSTAFKATTDVILGHIPLRGNAALQVFRANGLLRAAQLEPIHDAIGRHVFRLLHNSGIWHIYMALFGGRVCAVVHLPGPNDEPWRCLDLYAPIGTRRWVLQPVPTSIAMHPFRIEVEDHDLASIIPSIPLINVQSMMRVEPA